MKWLITLTWSKLMALLFQSLAFTIDVLYTKSGTVFMFCLPFSVFLLTGKQYFDSKKPETNKTE